MTTSSKNEGKADRVGGEIKEKVGEVKEKVEDVVDKAKDKIQRSDRSQVAITFARAPIGPMTPGSVVYRPPRSAPGHSARTYVRHHGAPVTARSIP